MAKKRAFTLLHRLLVGDGGPDNAFRAMFERGGELLAHEPGRGLRSCPPARAVRALVLRGVDPELVLGLKKPDAVECPS